MGSASAEIVYKYCGARMCKIQQWNFLENSSTCPCKSFSLGSLVSNDYGLEWHNPKEIWHAPCFSECSISESLNFAYLSGDIFGLKLALILQPVQRKS